MSKKRAVATKATTKKRVRSKRISIKKLIRVLDEDILAHHLISESILEGEVHRTGFICALESAKKYLEKRL